MIYLSWHKNMLQHVFIQERLRSQGIRALDTNFLIDPEGKPTEASYDVIQCAEAVLFVADGGELQTHQYLEYLVASSRCIPVNLLILNRGLTSSLFASFSLITDISIVDVIYTDTNPRYLAKTDDVIRDTIVANETSILSDQGMVTVVASNNIKLPLRFYDSDYISGTINSGDFVCFQVTLDQNRGSDIKYNVWSYVLAKSVESCRVLVLDGVPGSSIWVPGIVQSLNYNTIVAHKTISIPKLL